MASTSQILRALMSGDRLALIIALNPKAADVIPRGPLRSEFVAVSHGAEAALNPQPLPPAGVVVGARLMNKITAAALASGRGFGGQFMDDLDDWCGTGWPRRWPKGGPVLGPQPDPWFTREALLGGMLAAAEISAHYDDPEVIGAFDKAIEMLGEAAVTQL
ncbi:MAG TPA: hypothetical protein VGK18_01020 [Propionicimonas sp.]|jgi:hypothetical protein|uniref:hypothetical protein n=1 Tax=Propionicimonas sp. TaxID=1955623 RepID=UPI002F41CEE2